MRYVLVTTLVLISCSPVPDLDDVCSPPASVYSPRGSETLALDAPPAQCSLISLQVGQHELLASRTAALEYIGEVLSTKRHSNFSNMFELIQAASEDEVFDLSALNEDSLSKFLLTELLVASKAHVLDSASDQFLTSLILEKFDCRYPEGDLNNGGRLGKTTFGQVIYWNIERVY